MLTGLDIDWRSIVNAHLEANEAPNISPRVDWVAKPVTIGGHEVGRASSITWSPSVAKLVGFGHLETSLSGRGTEVSVQWELPGTGSTFAAPATVTTLPFLELRRS